MKSYSTLDDLVTVYQCADGSWRVAYYPFADKDRNLTKDQAMALVLVRWPEAKRLHDLAVKRGDA